MSWNQPVRAKVNGDSHAHLRLLFPLVKKQRVQQNIADSGAPRKQTAGPVAGIENDALIFRHAA
jgi:hypothetical protein